MDEYPQGDPITTHTARVAWGVGLATFGFSVVLQLGRGYALDLRLLLMAAAYGLAIGGMAFALAYVVAKVTPILYPEFLYRAQQVDRLRGEMETMRQQQYQTAQAQPVQAPAPTPAPRPQPADWREHLARYLFDGRLRVGGVVRPIPSDLFPEWLEAIAERRWYGELKTVSTRALDVIGITRFGNGHSPASITLNFLLEMGAIASMGDRQPYQWTTIGERTFPERSVPRPPSPVQGRAVVHVGGGTPLPPPPPPLTTTYFDEENNDDQELFGAE